jgi:hypothetical protein
LAKVVSNQFFITNTGFGIVSVGGISTTRGFGAETGKGKGKGKGTGSASAANSNSGKGVGGRSVSGKLSGVLCLDLGIEIGDSGGGGLVQ